MGLWSSSSKANTQNTSLTTSASNINEGGTAQNLNFGSGNVSDLTITDLGSVQTSLYLARDLVEGALMSAESAQGRAFSIASSANASENIKGLDSAQKILLIVGAVVLGVVYVKSK